MSILVTGGIGFIGSHTVVELLLQNKEVVILDDLSNSKLDTLEKIKMITGKLPRFYLGDYTDRNTLSRIFRENNIDTVMHFAGYKAVSESIKSPLKYYRNNVSGTITLLEVMNEFNIKNLIFSSSATVYGDTKGIACKEDMKRGETTNPYGTTKSMIEKILEDLYASDNSWNITVLRYFNPVGAHPTGLLGENPNGIPTNLMPIILRVASGEQKELEIFGTNYEETKDGTCGRDFIHVVDLAKGHIKALDKLEGYNIYNLGTGEYYTVREIIEKFAKVNNIEVPYKYAERRDGDLGLVYADVTKAHIQLNWYATKTLEDMCKDSWYYLQKKKDLI